MTTRLMAQRRRSDRSWPELKALLIMVSTLDLRTRGSTASLGCRPRSRACVTEDMSTAMWGNSGDCSIHGSMTARKAGGSPPPSMLTMLGATYSTTGHEEETTGQILTGIHADLLDIRELTKVEEFGVPRRARHRDAALAAANDGQGTSDDMRGAHHGPRECISTTIGFRIADRRR